MKLSLEKLIERCERGYITPFRLIELLGQVYNLYLPEGTIVGLLDSYQEIGDVKILADAAIESYKLERDNRLIKRFMKDIQNAEEF